MSKRKGVCVDLKFAAIDLSTAGTRGLTHGVHWVPSFLNPLPPHAKVPSEGRSDNPKTPQLMSLLKPGSLADSYSFLSYD